MRLDENTHVTLKVFGSLLIVIIPCVVWFMRLEAQCRASGDAVIEFRQREDTLIFELHDVNRRLAHIEGQLDSPVFVRAGKRAKK